MAVTEMAPPRSERRVPGLGTFFSLTILLTWGIAALFIFAPDLVGPAGLQNPFFVLAVWAPGFVGVFVAWRHLGREGLKGYFSRLTMGWMPAPGWWLLIVGIPAIVLAGALITGTIAETPVFSPWYSALSAVGAAFFLAGTVEELGWRGVALPLLQRRFTPLTSGLLLGLVWAIWHLPAFAMSGTVQSAWAFGPYLVGLLALSVIMAWFFNASKGSILMAWLVHFQVMNPLFPDAQPWDTVFYVVAAIAVVLLDPRRMLDRYEAVTELGRSEES